jgi:hypothetical protein
MVAVLMRFHQSNFSKPNTESNTGIKIVFHWKYFCMLTKIAALNIILKSGLGKKCLWVYLKVRKTVNTVLKCGVWEFFITGNHLFIAAMVCWLKVTWRSERKSWNQRD